MKLSKSNVINALPLILILLLWLLIVITNYTSGTNLSGWDNLHPEFNPLLNVSRSLNAVWQEYQGVGLLGGMAHAADLPRQIIFALVSPFIPVNLIRYIWVFLMLLIGPLGVYRLLYKNVSRTAALVAATAYLGNLATVQYFYTPFETFIAFFGFFPWLISLVKQYLDKGTRRSLVLLALVSLLSTTAFYVQTLFVTFVMVLSIFLLVHIVKNRAREALSRSSKVLLTIVLVNSFWLLPVGYFSVTKGGTVEEAKINSIATPETQSMNQVNGNLKDISMLKGFWFDYTDARGDEFQYLMPEWRSHIDSPIITASAMLISILSIIGFVLQFRKHKGLVIFSTLGLTLSVLMLTAGNGLLGTPFRLLDKFIPLFGEMFRSPFTKWSMVAAFFVALGLGLFADKIYKKSGVALIVLPLLIVLPVFKGHLFSQDMRAKIPSQYQDLQLYLNTQNSESRIAFFPVQSFWGWNFYDWGYRGSGFLWYGIKQPILDRAFDVWSQDNENFYLEISDAVYSNNPDQFQKVLDKYQVTYVLLDESVVAPGNDNSEKLLNFSGIKDVLQKENIELAWQEGSLSLYKNKQKDSFVFAPDSFTQASLASSNTGRKDPAYEKYGTYVQTNQSTIFPFSDLAQEKVDASYTNNIQGDKNIELIKNLSHPDGKYVLSIPALLSNNFETTGHATYSGGVFRLSLNTPVFYINDEELTYNKILPMEAYLVNPPQSVLVQVGSDKQNVNEISNPESKIIEHIKTGQDGSFKINIYDNNNFDVVNIAEDLLNQDFNKCWEREGTKGKFEKSVENGVLKITSQDAVGCLAVKLTNLSKESVIEVSLPYRSSNGAKPHFCLVEEGSSNCLNEDVFYHTQTSLDWTVVTRRTVVKPGKSYWLIISGRPPEDKGESWTIDYKAPSVQVHPLIVSQNYPDVLEPLSTPRNFSISSPLESFAVSVPTSIYPLSFSNKVDTNCDIFKRGEVSKDFNQDTSVNYIAKARGAICDYSVSGKAVSSGEYLLRLQGVNTEGRGLKFYAYNPLSTVSKIEALITQKQFDSSFSLPAIPGEPTEYTISTEVRSFGLPAKTTLTQASLYTAPLSWLSQIQITPETFEGKTDNHITIKQTRKIGTTFYKANISVQKDDSLLLLSQGYDAGWVAKKGSVFGKTLEHHEVNSWENGWLVPEGEYDVVIFYWPQMLEYVGFALLLLTALVVLI